MLEQTQSLFFILGELLEENMETEQPAGAKVSFPLVKLIEPAQKSQPPCALNRIGCGSF